ncbi:MAG: nuclear transport factor 2 family protein [Rudaea sp.]
MRTRPLAACLALALSTIAMARADEPSQDIRKDIVDLTQKLMDAVGEGKSEVWNRVLADDALITDEFGRRQTKNEAVDAIHPLPPGFSGSIEVRDPHVRVYGNSAVIDFEDYENETVFGQKLLVRYISTATYVRQGDAWKLVTMLDVTLPTAPPKLDVAGLKLDDYVATYRYAPERAWIVEVDHDKLQFRTKAGRPPIALDAIAKDVFMGGDDEKNVMIFRRDGSGRVTELVERRKFNDLHLKREPGAK